MELTPIGWVKSSRTDVKDDHWDSVHSQIVLAEKRFGSDSLTGLAEFSHIEVIFQMDQVEEASIEAGARHPRNNPNWPKVGIFAQRGKNRPNRLGVSVVRIVGIDGAKLHVAELDAIDGTPVVDIKPVLREFLPRGELRQPAWASELMASYW